MCRMKMSDLLSKYGKSASITQPILDRMKDIWNAYELVYNVDVTDVFVSEHKNSDDERVFGSAWFFAEKHIMEAKNFIVGSDVDILRIENGLKYCKITAKEYDFRKAAESSRLYAYIGFGESFGSDMDAEFRATGSNCDCLRDILKEYFISEIVR